MTAQQQLRDLFLLEISRGANDKVIVFVDASTEIFSLRVYSDALLLRHLRQSGVDLFLVDGSVRRFENSDDGSQKGRQSAAVLDHDAGNADAQAFDQIVDGFLSAAYK